MNQAVSYALKNAIIGTSPNFSLDYSKLSFAWGSIQFPDDINVAVLTGTTIKIDWVTTLRTEDETPDELNLVLMNADSKFIILMKVEVFTTSDKKFIIKKN